MPTENNLHAILKTGNANYILDRLIPSQADFVKIGTNQYVFKFKNNYHLKDNIYNGALNNNIDENNEHILILDEKRVVVLDFNIHISIFIIQQKTMEHGLNLVQSHHQKMLVV